MLGESRCERSPTPVKVGANTRWPCAVRRSRTRCQHQPPCQAPWTSTNVAGFRALPGWDEVRPSAGAASAAMAAVVRISRREARSFRGSDIVNHASSVSRRNSLAFQESIAVEPQHELRKPARAGLGRVAEAEAVTAILVEVELDRSP